MALFLISTVVFGLAIFGLSLGVVFSDRSIKGSCGGVAQLRDRHGKPLCDGCTSGGTGCDGKGKHGQQGA